jgi:hypothetical protein
VQRWTSSATARIPLIVVSPWAKKGVVDHTYYDHASIAKFIERNWSLPPLSARSRDNLPNPVHGKADPYVPLNRPAIGDLMPLFDFSAAGASHLVQRTPAAWLAFLPFFQGHAVAIEFALIHVFHAEGAAAMAAVARCRRLRCWFRIVQCRWRDRFCASDIVSSNRWHGQ